MKYHQKVALLNAAHIDDTFSVLAKGAIVALAQSFGHLWANGADIAPFITAIETGYPVSNAATFFEMTETASPLD